MSNIENLAYKNIEFDDTKRVFTIGKGSIGTYSYDVVKKANVLSEDSSFTGKTLPFSHTVLTGPFQPATYFPRKVYVGVKIRCEKEDLYLYISDKPLQIQVFDFYDDEKKANKIKKKFQSIIQSLNSK